MLDLTWGIVLALTGVLVLAMYLVFDVAYGIEYRGYVKDDMKALISGEISREILLSRLESYERIFRIGFFSKYIPHRVTKEAIKLARERD